MIAYRLIITKEPPGVLHESKAMYTCSVDCYLYIASSIEELFLTMSQEWQHEKHYVS